MLHENKIALSLYNIWTLRLCYRSRKTLRIKKGTNEQFLTNVWGGMNKKMKKLELFRVWKMKKYIKVTK